MRAAVVCVLALAFAAFAAASVRAAAADVEMVEAELVDANHPALMEVVQRRGLGDGDKKPKAMKGGKGKGKGLGKGKLATKPTKSAKEKSKSKVKAKTKTKPTKVIEPKFNGNTGIAGGLPGASKVPGQPATGKRRFGTGAKGGQASDKWDPYGKSKGGKGKRKVVKGDFPTPGKESKTIGGHGTGAFGGQKADGWDGSDYGDRAVNKDATKGGPIGGAFSKLFGHKMGEPKPSGGPLTGKPPQYRNTGIVPPGIGGN